MVSSKSRDKMVQEGLWRVAKIKVLLGELFDEQLSVATCTETLISLCCGRRSGKTTMNAVLLCVALLKAKPGEGVFYAGLTGVIAKRQILPTISRLNDKHKLGFAIKQHLGEVHTRSGAALVVLGMDNVVSLDKIRGEKCRLVILDEIQAYARRMQTLIDDVVMPSLGDLRGRLIVTGTPGPVPAGYWHEVSSGKHGFKTFHWNVLRNRFFADPQGWLNDTLRLKGWDETEPTYQREYLGKWVVDHRALAFDFDPERNIVEKPSDYSKSWRHYLGIDYGYNPDPNAFVVLAVHPHKHLVLVVHAEKRDKMLSDDIAQHTKDLIAQYGCRTVTADSAEPKEIAEFNRRYGGTVGVYVKPANKLGKAIQIATLNTELRRSRLQLVRGTCDDLVEELLSVTWLDADRVKLDPAKPNDGVDALQYGYSPINPHWVSEEVAAQSPDDKAWDDRRRAVANATREPA